MADDKLVDSTQLDADLTSVANAIRTKGGTSASLLFPSEFVSAIQAIPTGGGSTVDYKKGTYTPTQDYTATGNREITTISNIGFTPKLFLFYPTTKADLSGIQYAVIFAVFLQESPLRVTARFSNTSGSVSATVAQSSWTTQSNYYLYTNGTSVYFRTTSAYILKGSVEYTWEALG